MTEGDRLMGMSRLPAGLAGRAGHRGTVRSDRITTGARPASTAAPRSAGRHPAAVTRRAREDV